MVVVCVMRVKAVMVLVEYSGQEMEEGWVCQFQGCLHGCCKLVMDDSCDETYNSSLLFIVWVCINGT